MIRFIANAIRIIVITYLVIILIIFAFFLTQEKLYEISLPSIKGYSYIHYQNNHLEPNINDNEFVLIQKTSNIDTGDYVVYIKNDIKKIKKVISRDKYILEISYIDGTEKETLKLDDAFGKVIYQNKVISDILNVITNYVVIIIMIVYASLIPSLTYKRYS